MANSFASQKFYDHQILDDEGSVVGYIRVKPSGVLWASKGSHQWYRVSLDTFAELMKKNGTKQKK